MSDRKHWLIPYGAEIEAIQTISDWMRSTDDYSRASAGAFCEAKDIRGMNRAGFLAFGKRVEQAIDRAKLAGATRLEFTAQGTPYMV